jgi:hypothetical protein
MRLYSVKKIIMRIFILLILLTSISCKKSSIKEQPLSTLHGTWDSLIIRSTEPNPPVKVQLQITAYNDTKLTYMKMTAISGEKQKFEKTIRISLGKKGYIIPSLSVELDSNPKSFILYNPASKREVKGLEWKYILSGDELTIEMGSSHIMFKKVK